MIGDVSSLSGWVSRWDENGTVGTTSVNSHGGRGMVWSHAGFGAMARPGEYVDGNRSVKKDEWI